MNIKSVNWTMFSELFDDNQFSSRIVDVIPWSDGKYKVGNTIFSIYFFVPVLSLAVVIVVKSD